MNIYLEIGDFRMETSLGPTLAEFIHGPDPCIVLSRVLSRDIPKTADRGRSR